MVDDVRFASSRTSLNVRRTLLYRSLTISAPFVPSTDITPVTSASVIFTGKSVSIGDATQPGSGDVQFASTRTRLNVRQTLLYRSLTTAPRVGGVTDTTTVTQATVVFTGKTVISIDADVTPVTKATITVFGKPLTEFGLVPINKASVTFAGQTIAVGDSAPTGSNDVRFASIRTTRTLRRGLLYRSLTAPPRVGGTTDTTSVTKADIVFAGKAITGLDTEITSVLKASIVVTGKTITGLEIVPILKASVTFAGQTVALVDPGVDRVIVDKADVLFTGQTIDPSTEITKAAIIFVGKTVTVRDFEVTPVAKATVLFTGQTVTIPADTPVSAKLVISYTPGGNRQDLTGNLGMVFALSVDATFDQIGLRCGLDNTGIHTVDLYDYATGTLLRTGNVNLTGATEGQFYYTSIAPITLVAGTYYALGAQTTASDGQWWASNGPTTLHDAAFVAAAYRSAGVWTSTALVDQQYLGVDLGYAVTGVTEVIPIGPGAIRFTGQEVTLTGQGEVQPPIGGGGGVTVPPWIVYGRKHRRRYRALEEIEKRIDARIEKLKAETKEKQQQVAEVISQPWPSVAGAQIDVLSQQFAELLRQQALITGMLLEAQRRAEAVRQERIQLAILAQRAAEAIDEEEAITMLLLT